MHESVTIPEEDWCLSGEVLQMELIPKIKDVEDEEMKEVAIWMCESNSFDCSWKFVCSKLIFFFCFNWQVPRVLQLRFFQLQYQEIGTNKYPVASMDLLLEKW
jgi:hypothetical protein